MERKIIYARPRSSSRPLRLRLTICRDGVGTFMMSLTAVLKMLAQKIRFVKAIASVNIPGNILTEP